MLLPVVSGCLLLGLVVRCCLLVASFVGAVHVWQPGLLPCCVLLLVVVPYNSVLCAVVLCFSVVLCCCALLSVLLCWLCLFVLCPGLGRGAALPCCAACGMLSVAPRAVFCGAFCAVLYRRACVFSLCCALLLLLRWSVPRDAACGFWLFVGTSCCPLFFPGGALRRLRPCLGAWPAPLLLVVVCGGTLFPCVVSCGAVPLCCAVLLCPGISYAVLLVFACAVLLLKALHNL